MGGTPSPTFWLEPLSDTVLAPTSVSGCSALCPRLGVASSSPDLATLNGNCSARASVPAAFVANESRVSIARPRPLGPLTVDFAEVAEAAAGADERRAVFFGAALLAGLLPERFFIANSFATDGGRARQTCVQATCRTSPRGTRLASRS